MGTLPERIIRALRLDATLYEEVEADTGAMSQAMLIVVLASVAGGVASASATGVPSGFVGGAIGALLGWYVWAFLTYFIGTKILPEAETHADFGQLLRVLGFAAAPGLIQLAGFIPALAKASVGIANLWMLAAMVVAVRQALDYRSTGRALVVCAIGWVIQGIILLGMLGLLVGGIWYVAGGLPSKPSM